MRNRAIQNYLGQVFSDPRVQAISQANLVTAAMSTYFGGKYAKDQFENILLLVEKVKIRVENINDRFIDKSFFDSKDGRRLAAKIIEGVFKDGRKEKVDAAANLISNLQLKSKVSIDEKELFVEILDGLNPLQISILFRVVNDMRGRWDGSKHRGFGWEILAKDYVQKGVGSYLLLQSIRSLESNGLVNKNEADARDSDQTHFITEFGEKFHDFICDVLREGSPYL